MAVLGSTEKTNELLGGQYFNPTTGIQEKPFIPTTQQMPVITPESMQGVSQLPPVPQSPSEVDFGAITANIANQFSGQQEEAPTPYTDVSTGLLSNIKNLLGETSGKAEYSAQAFEASGANELARRQRELTAMATSLNNEVSAAQLSLERDAGTKGLSTTFLNRQLREVSRNAAIRSLAINSEYAMNAGNLETAKESAQRAVDIKYGDLESKIAQNEKLLQLYSPFMNAEQQERADARAAANAEKKQELADKKKAQQDIINLAQDRGDSKTASDAIRLDPNSPTFQEDLANLQEKIAPDQERSLEIEGMRLSNQKLIQDISTGSSNLSPESLAIIDNPSLFDDLTPTTRGKIISQLQANGYDTSNLGTKPLSDTAITTIAQSQKALSDLAGLREILVNNISSVGPIVGLEALNPWSQKRKIQADIDRVRQTVGKALEGGVLRKEDEEKYKKILATITDTPDTALYKIDSIISSIQRDIENYKNLQGQSGKSLNVRQSLTKTEEEAQTVEQLRERFNY